MSNRYISGFIAGGLIGAVTAIIISSRTENDMKKKMIAGGKSMADVATRIMPRMKTR